MMTLSIDPHIFREYDIRGDVRTQLTPEAVYAIGRALGAAHFSAGSTLVIGRDGRTHSPMLAQKLISGLRKQGVNIIDIGQVTTPMLYFSLFTLPAAGGVMVTGSHNPVNDNGLKICRGTESFVSRDIKAIQSKLCEEIAPAELEGKIEAQDILPEYIRAILGQLPVCGAGLQIVCDTGSGAAGPFVRRIIGQYADTLTMLYEEPDGRFPYHHPDPSSAENMSDCQKAVIAHRADVGLAFDGDGDRLGAVDEEGCIIPADRLILLFAREILSRRPGAVICADVKCSQQTFSDIQHHGGQAIMTKTGHALIKAKIRETNAALAGEMSGHFFFGDRWFGFDDAIYAAARLCEIVSNAHKSGKTLHELLSDLPPVIATPEIRLSCPDDIKFGLSQAMAERFSAEYPTCTLDGARIDFPEGWALVRASNTQPVIVIRAEAESSAGIRKILNMLIKEMKIFTDSHGIALNYDILSSEYHLS